tara:strand:+ start:1326 stop:1514 length:189 start_codon:yes stop_codon:yes gene_type:complete
MESSYKINIMAGKDLADAQLEYHRNKQSTDAYRKYQKEYQKKYRERKRNEIIEKLNHYIKSY